MNGLSVIITIFVLTIITVINLTIMIHFNKQFHMCDADSAFWCHSDWQCLNGTNDSNGVVVGNGEEGIVPMNCYLLGLYGKISGTDDAVCGKWFDAYNRKQSLCQGDDEDDAENPICKGSGDVGGKWPCSCNEILNTEFGANAFKVGFMKGQSGSGQFIMNKMGTAASCNEGDENCIGIRDVITKQIGNQLAGISLAGYCSSNAQ